MANEGAIGAFIGVYVCQLILVLVCYYCWNSNIYKKKQTLSSIVPKPQPLAQNPDQDFGESLFGCLSNLCSCLVVWWCPALKVVETALTAEVIQQDQVCVHVLLATCFLPCYMLFAHPCQRATIRANLGGRKDGWGAADFLLSWCCTICVLAQEAREVDRAVDAESRVCCTLHKYGTSEPAVGPAVKVEAP